MTKHIVWFSQEGAGIGEACFNPQLTVPIVLTLSPPKKKNPNKRKISVSIQFVTITLQYLRRIYIPRVNFSYFFFFFVSIKLQIIRDGEASIVIRVQFASPIYGLILNGDCLASMFMVAYNEEKESLSKESCCLRENRINK